MSGTECRAWWNEQFPDSPPVGFMLRQAYPQRWLRIHSLPESKRFAETKEEYTELLLRHNIVATETLGEGSRCYLIQGCWGKPGERQDGWIVAIESEALDIQFGVVETIWSYRQHEGLLREVADCKKGKCYFRRLR